MAVKTEEVRHLADFAPEDCIVTTLYLDVNAGQFPDTNHVQTSLHSVIHNAEAHRDAIEETLSHDAQASLKADLRKIKAYLGGEFAREDGNGVAIFSCAAHDFWRVVSLAERVDNAMMFGPRPYLAPLAPFLSHHKPTAILLTDKEHARILTMEGGMLKEWADFEDSVPQRSDQSGWSQNRYQRRLDHWKKHHIDKAAELALRLQKFYPFDWLVVGAEVQSETDVKNSLHPYLKDSVIGTIHVRIDAPNAEIVEHAQAAIERAESELIGNLVAQVQEFAGAGGRGTAGLSDTINVLNEQRVHILLVQQGYSAPGSICPNCNILMARKFDRCPGCDQPAVHVDNLVDYAVQRAYESGSVVEVATEEDALETVGCVAAILYY